MVQVIIGKQVSNGFIQKLTCKYSGESSIDSVVSLITESINEVTQYLQDTSIVTNWSQGNATTFSDVLSLAYSLNQQGITLLVTDVAAKLGDDKSIFKFIKPLSNGPIKNAVDYIYDDTMEGFNLIEAFKAVAQDDSLFDPSIFINNPIENLWDAYESLSSKGLPTNDLQNEVALLVESLGYKVIYIEA